MVALFFCRYLGFFDKSRERIVKEKEKSTLPLVAFASPFSLTTGLIKERYLESKLILFRQMYQIIDSSLVLCPYQKLYLTLNIILLNMDSLIFNEYIFIKKPFI